jgi:hypothetical protein
MKRYYSGESFPEERWAIMPLVQEDGWSRTTW